jgi:nitrate/nitrite transporter NarK
MEGLTDAKVLLLSLIYFCWIVGYWGFTFWMPRMIQRATGADPSTVGLLVLIPMGTAFVCSILIGHSASKHGELKKHVGFPLVIASVGFTLMSLFDGPVIAIFALTLIAVGVAGPIGTWWAIPTSFLTGAAAAGATGLINSVGNIGGFVGPNIVGFFRSVTGIERDESVFIVFAVTLAISAVLVLTLKLRNEKEPA